MAAPDALLPSALRNRTSYVLVKLTALARQQSAGQVAAWGLNQHQHAILCCLDEFGPACQKDIAARLGVDVGDTVSFVDGLQRAGLIRLTPGRTARQYASGLDDPLLGDGLRATLGVFEEVYYGHRHPGPEELERVWPRAEALRRRLQAMKVD